MRTKPFDDLQERWSASHTEFLVHEVKELIASPLKLSRWLDEHLSTINDSVLIERLEFGFHPTLGAKLLDMNTKAVGGVQTWCDPETGEGGIVCKQRVRALRDAWFTPSHFDRFFVVMAAVMIELPHLPINLDTVRELLAAIDACDHTERFDEDYRPSCPCMLQEPPDWLFRKYYNESTESFHHWFDRFQDEAASVRAWAAAQSDQESGFSPPSWNDAKADRNVELNGRLVSVWFVCQVADTTSLMGATEQFVTEDPVLGRWLHVADEQKDELSELVRRINYQGRVFGVLQLSQSAGAEIAWNIPMIDVPIRKFHRMVEILVSATDDSVPTEVRFEYQKRLCAELGNLSQEITVLLEGYLGFTPDVESSMEEVLKNATSECGLDGERSGRARQRATARPPVQWEASSRTITVGERSTQFAPNLGQTVRTVFGAFQESGWPNRIDHPVANREKAKEALKTINRKSCGIRIRADGDQLAWEII